MCRILVFISMSIYWSIHQSVGRSINSFTFYFIGYSTNVHHSAIHPFINFSSSIPSINQQSIYPSEHLSIHSSISLSVKFFIHPSIYFYLSRHHLNFPPINLLVHPSIHLSVQIFINPSTFHLFTQCPPFGYSRYSSLHLFIHLFQSFINHSIHQSISNQSIHLSIHLFIHSSTLKYIPLFIHLSFI